MLAKIIEPIHREGLVNGLGESGQEKLGPHPGPGSLGGVGLI